MMNGAESDADRNARNEAEAGILGVLMWLPNFAGPRLEMVDVEFQEPRHRNVLEAIRTLHAEKKGADLAGVLEWLATRNQLEAAGGREYVTGMVDMACLNGAYQFERYVAEVKKRAEVGDQRSGSGVSS